LYFHTFINYNKKDKKIESNIGFNVSGEKLLVITKGATPYVYEQPFPSLNYNFSKGIGEHYFIEFAVKNILNSEYKAVHHFNVEQIVDVNYIKYSIGRTYSLTFKYIIK